MLCFHSGPVLALHPMFGPGIKFTYRGQLTKSYKIINCGGRKSHSAGRVIKGLKLLGFNLIDMAASKHDALTTYIQGLHYFSVFMEVFSIYKKPLSLQSTAPIFFDVQKQDVRYDAIKKLAGSQDDTIRNM